MAQIFQYLNLLSGTRSGEGWRYGGPDGAGAVGYTKVNNALTLQGTSKSEFFLKSPIVVLHRNTDYTLHCFAANTANMSSTELFVLDYKGYSSSYNWIGHHSYLTSPGPGGVGSMSRSGSIPIRGMADNSISASTTTALRTARTASYGSKTSCSPRARSRTHGHRQKGRCGLNELRSL